jgi:hypothetical protein
MVKLKKNSCYENIYFSGSGYLNIYQLGVALCLFDNNITFKNSYSTSAGFVPSIGSLSSDQQLFDFLLLAMIKSRFSECFYFGHTHFSEVMKVFIDTCLKHFDLTSIFPRIHIGARDIFFNNIWFDNFESNDDFSDAITSTTRLIPFISLIPHKNFYIDQLMISDINGIVFDLCVCPFPENFIFCLPPSYLTIRGQNNYINLHKMLNPSYYEMVREFINGYIQTLSHIEDAASRDIYEYILHINKKLDNCEYKFEINMDDIDMKIQTGLSSLYETLYYKIRNYFVK